MRYHAIIYSDGGCYPNPGPGAWAAIVRCDGRDLEMSEYVSKTTTNNRMEMTAAIRGLEYLCSIRIQTHPAHPSTLPRSVLLVSDSKLLLNGISWIDGWKKQGWRTRAGTNVVNRDLWEQIDLLKRRFRIETQWVRGHSGHPENERCDALCSALIRSGGRISQM